MNDLLEAIGAAIRDHEPEVFTEYERTAMEHLADAVKSLSIADEVASRDAGTPRKAAPWTFDFVRRYERRQAEAFPHEEPERTLSNLAHADVSRRAQAFLNSPALADLVRATASAAKCQDAADRVGSRATKAAERRLQEDLV